MSFTTGDQIRYSVTAASAYLFGVAVMGDPASDEKMLAAGSIGAEGIGISAATVATYGLDSQVVFRGVAKGLVAASLGAWARVGPANASGALGPALASGQLASSGASAGLYPARYSVGQALAAGVAGDIIPVLLDPRQIV